MQIQFKDENFGFSGAKISVGHPVQKEGKTDKKNPRSLFAGNLNQPEDRVEQRKKEAQKKAMKIMSDVQAGEKKIDMDLEERRLHIEKARELKGDAKQQLYKLEDEMAKLKESAEVDPDSQEQKDLDLLIKDMYANPVSGETLTDEEKKRVKELKGSKLTEYQEKMLSLEKNKEPFQEQKEEAENIIKKEAAVITAVGLERLKSSPMTKASKEAKEVMDAASKDVIGMVMQEAKDHIDEEMQDNIEAAEKKKEEEAEQEKLIEEAKKNKLEAEKKTEEGNDAASSEEAVQADIQKEIISGDGAKGDIEKKLREIEEKLKLLGEDLKGAAVDTYS